MLLFFTVCDNSVMTFIKNFSFYTLNNDKMRSVIKRDILLFGNNSKIQSNHFFVFLHCTYVNYTHDINCRKTVPIRTDWFNASTIVTVSQLFV